MLGLPAVLLLFALLQSAVPPTDLSIVRGHYASAAFEEALQHLNTLPPDAVTADLEQYRALCLLALGLTAEGEAAFERLVRQAPLYRIPESDVSPRIHDVFRAVRTRVLPAVVRDRYALGQAAYEAQAFEAAAAEFTTVLQLLDDSDAATVAPAFADLRKLADGFLRLSEAEVTLAARAAALAAAPPPAPEPVPPPQPEPEPRTDVVQVTRIVVYSAADTDVTPPVEVQRFMPPWTPPSPLARLAEYRGELEVVINEAGRVEQATMLRSAHPTYDIALVGATERWQFEPARRDGTAVKYRQTFAIVLSPPAE